MPAANPTIPIEENCLETASLAVKKEGNCWL